MVVAIAIGVLVAVPALAAVLRVALRRTATIQRRLPLPAPQPRQARGSAIEEQIDSYVREALGATRTRLPTGATPLRLARGSVAPPARGRTVRDVSSDLDEDVTLVSSRPLR